MRIAAGVTKDLWLLGARLMEQTQLASAHQFGVACTQCQRLIVLSARPSAREFSAACNRCGVRSWYRASAVVPLEGPGRFSQKLPQPQT